MKSEEILYGINPILEVLRANPSSILKIFIAQGKTEKSIHELQELAERHRVPLAFLPRGILDQRAGTTHHQGVLALASPLAESSVEHIIAHWRRSGDRLLVLIADGIQDPQNLGALIRTACACGAHGVIMAKDRAAPLTGAVFKASAGALAYIPIARVVNIARAMEHLKKYGAWIVGADSQGTTCLYTLEGSLDLALVIGSEGKGLRPLIKRGCDFLVHIPLRGKISSLNASAAGAIALYEII